MTSVSDRSELLQLMMLLLPLENVTLLRHLLDLLHRTSEEKDNLMDRNALAIVIAPNLFTLHNVSSSLLFRMDLPKLWSAARYRSPSDGSWNSFRIFI